MAEEKKITRLADVGELEADLKKDLAEEEAKGKAADILFCESIEDELSDLEKLPTIDPKTLRPVAHWEDVPGSYKDHLLAQQGGNRTHRHAGRQGHMALHHAWPVPQHHLQCLYLADHQTGMLWSCKPQRNHHAPEAAEGES